MSRSHHPRGQQRRWLAHLRDAKSWRANRETVPRREHTRTIASALHDLWLERQGVDLASEIRKRGDVGSTSASRDHEDWSWYDDYLMECADWNYGNPDQDDEQARYLRRLRDNYEYGNPDVDDDYGWHHRHDRLDPMAPSYRDQWLEGCVGGVDVDEDRYMHGWYDAWCAAECAVDPEMPASATTTLLTIERHAERVLAGRRRRDARRA